MHWRRFSFEFKLQLVSNLKGATCKSKVLFGVCFFAIVVRLQFLARLETNCFTRRDRNFLAGARVPANPALSRFDNKDAKTAQFDAVAARQRVLHRMKQSINSLLSFQFRDARLIGKAVDDVQLNHEFEPPVFGDRC